MRLSSTRLMLSAGLTCLSVGGVAGCASFAFYEDTKVAIAITVDPSAPDPLEISAAFKEGVFALAPVKRRVTPDNRNVIDTGPVLADFDVRYGANASATPGPGRDILYAMITHGLATGAAAHVRRAASDAVLPLGAVDRAWAGGVATEKVLEERIAQTGRVAELIGIKSTIQPKLDALKQAGQTALRNLGERLPEIGDCDANNAIAKQLIKLQREALTAQDEATRRARTTDFEAQRELARYKVILDARALLRQLQDVIESVSGELIKLDLKAGISGPQVTAAQAKLDDLTNRLNAAIPTTAHQCRQ